jgi:uncharacterized protein YceK
MKRLIITSAVVLVMTGCSTVGTKAQTQTQAPLPSPTPAVVKDQTMPAQGKVENSATIDIPAWYIKAPASTEDYVYLTGTGISSDLSMSRSKALLDAQVQLADKINGMVNALIKQNKRDDAGNVNTDRTTQTVKKVIIDTAITGYHLEDSKVMSENRGYRTFVLVRYPIGDANRMLKDKLQRERTDIETDSAADRELEQEMDQRRPKKAPAVDKSSKAEMPIYEQQAKADIPPVVDIRPVPKAEPQPKLIDTDNAEYKRRRAEALKKPGAFVEHVTVQ